MGRAWRCAGARRRSPTPRPGASRTALLCGARPRPPAGPDRRSALRDGPAWPLTQPGATPSGAAAENRSARVLIAICRLTMRRTGRRDAGRCRLARDHRGRQPVVGGDDGKGAIPRHRVGAESDTGGVGPIISWTMTAGAGGGQGRPLAAHVGAHGRMETGFPDLAMRCACPAAGPQKALQLTAKECSAPSSSAPKGTGTANTASCGRPSRAADSSRRIGLPGTRSARADPRVPDRNGFPRAPRWVG